MQKERAGPLHHYESLRHYGLAGRVTSHVGFDDVAARVEAFLTFERSTPEELPDRVSLPSRLGLLCLTPFVGVSSWCCTVQPAAASRRSFPART